MQPVTISTVADFLDHGQSLTAHCRGCNRYAEVDLMKLPREMDLYRPRPRFVCSACGSDDVGLIVASAKAGGVGGAHGGQG